MKHMFDVCEPVYLMYLCVCVCFHEYIIMHLLQIHTHMWHIYKCLWVSVYLLRKESLSFVIEMSS